MLVMMAVIYVQPVMLVKVVQLLVQLVRPLVTAAVLVDV